MKTNFINRLYPYKKNKKLFLGQYSGKPKLELKQGKIEKNESERVETDESTTTEEAGVSKNIAETFEN